MHRTHPTLVLSLTVFGCLGSFAYADGCFFVKEMERTADIYEPEQKAFIWYQDGVEDLVLQAAYEGEVTEFAWVVPVPAQPGVDKVEGALFHELSELTEIHRHKDYGRGMDVAGEAGALPGVAVLERKQVGHYDVAVLAATEADALVNWLDENGYAQPEGAEEVLDHYVQRAWFYVAMRIAAATEAVAEKLRAGIMAPLRLTFSAESIVYPFRLTALNPGGTEVLLYVGAADAVQAEGLSEEFCAQVKAAEVPERDYPTLAGLVSADFVLTKLRAYFAQEDILDDILVTKRSGRAKPLAEVKNPPPSLGERVGGVGRVAAWPARAALRGVGAVVDAMEWPPWLGLLIACLMLVLFSVVVVKIGGGVGRLLWRVGSALRRRASGDADQAE